jgi:hypothetical protein
VEVGRGDGRCGGRDRGGRRRAAAWRDGRLCAAGCGGQQRYRQLAVHTDGGRAEVRHRVDQHRPRGLDPVRTVREPGHRHDQRPGRVQPGLLEPNRRLGPVPGAFGDQCDGVLGDVAGHPQAVTAPGPVERGDRHQLADEVAGLGVPFLVITVDGDEP